MDLPPPAYLQQPTTNHRMKRHPELQPYVPSDRDRKAPTTNHAKPRTQQLIASSSRQTSKTRLVVHHNNHEQRSLPSRKPIASPATKQAAQLTSQPSSQLSSQPSSQVSSNQSSNHDRAAPPSPLTPQITNTTTTIITTAASPTKTASPSLLTTANEDKTNNSTLGVIDSQMSINERLYQSAASDLSQNHHTEEEVSKSTNGDYHENHGSLFNDLEAELIAEGIVKTEPVTPKLSMSVVSGDPEESIRRQSTPEIKPQRDGKLDMIFKKAEEELQENARRMEEERQNRQSLIESILSKVNQSS